MCHPMVGVSRFGSNVPGRLSSRSYDIFTSRTVSRLAHVNVGRDARTYFFEVMFRVRY